MKAQDNRSHIHVYKSCITQQDLDKNENAFLTGEPGLKCDNKLSRHTRTAVAGTFHCTKGGMVQSGDFAYEARDREHIAGTMNISVSNGTNTMASKGSLSGQWISASCGNTP
jgi:Protein of unknown function (DUF3617)